MVPDALVSARKRFRKERAISNIREVAKHSGVSVSTVSRVFNGYDDVSPATRERVLEVARRLDYAPSAAARTLVKQQSQLIGVVLFTGYEHPDIHHPFFQEVLVGLKHGIGELGYDLLLFATEQPGASRGRPHSYLRRARQHRVDGIVVMGVDQSDPEVEKLVRSDVPVMAVDLDVVGRHTSFVASDNIGGARLAVRHLHGLGHTHIATISGPRDTKPGADRALGYRAEMRELGLAIPPGYEVEGDFYPDSAEHAMRDMLALPEPPTAVFVAADMMAVGAIRAIRAAGLSVPEDVAIVGFDDIRVAELLSPALTTVRQDMVGIGLAAGRALVEQIENPEVTPPVLTLPVDLVVRASCGSSVVSGVDG
ncbi:MAG TPA: LacI family DNA-binding transcriptional regulator [Gaiellaceae bacterium]|nr:LacI family DNA-binding transcriptional regulator [Gaiellaceae bacterium]